MATVLIGDAAVFQKSGNFETFFTPDSFPIMDSEGQSNLNVLVMETFYLFYNFNLIFYFLNLLLFFNLHPS